MNKISTFKKNISIIFFLVIALLLSYHSKAGSRFWVGGSGSWASTLFWSTTSGGVNGASVPVAGDDVIFDVNSGDTIIVTGISSQTIHSLKITGNANVTLQSASTATLSVLGTTLTNNIVISGGSALTLSASITLTYLTTASQRGDISGNLNINTGSAFITSAISTTVVTVSPTGVITNNGGTITSTAATLIFNGTYTHAMDGGAIALATYNAVSTCNITGIINTNPTQLSGAYGNLIWNCKGQNTATGAISAAMTVNGNLSVLAGTLSDGGFQITGNATGKFTVASGATFTDTRILTPWLPTLFSTANISLDQNSIVNFNGTGNFTIPNTHVTTYGTLGIGGSGVKTLAALTTVKSLNIAAGTLADGGFQITGNDAGTLTVAAGATLQVGAGTASITGFPANFITENITLRPTSTVNYNTITNPQTISATPSAYGNLTITGASGIKIAAGNILVAGNLIIATAGETLADGGNTITVNGNINNLATHSGTGKIYLNGGSAQHNLSGGGTFGNLELDDSNGAILTGNITVGQALTNTLTLTNGAFNVAGYTLSLNGAAIAGTPTNLSTTTTSNLSFGPNTNKNSGLFIPSSIIQLNNLTINVASANSVTINSNIILNQVTADMLTLTQGRLILGSHDLTIATPNYVAINGTFGTGTMIVADGTGQLKKVFGTSGFAGFTFPVGDVSGPSNIADYSPYTLTFSANSVNRTIGVRVTDAQDPNDKTLNDYVSRYYSLTDDQFGNGTYTYGGSFTYSTNAPSDLTGTFANIFYDNWNGNLWTQFANIGISPTVSTVASAMTQATAPIGATSGGISEVTARVNTNIYTWIATSGIGDWQVASNWTPARNMISATDILQFKNGGTPTVNNIPAQTVGSISVTGNTNISLVAAATSALTLGYVSGPSNVLTIDSASALQLSSGLAIAQTLAFNNTATFNTKIAGNLIIKANNTNTNTISFANLSVTNNTITGTLTNNGGVVTATAANTKFGSTSSYIHNMNGGTIPTATWSAGSTCNVTGVTNTVPAGLGQTFGNFIWNCTGQSSTIKLAGNLTGVNGNLTFTSTGTTQNIFSLAGVNYTLNVGGNLFMTGGDVRLQTSKAAVSTTLKVSGNCNLSGGVLTINGADSSAMATTGVFTVTGDLNLSGTGVLELNNSLSTSAASIGTFNLSGNYNQTGGTFKCTANKATNSVNFNGTGNYIQSGGTVLFNNNFNYTIGATGKLTLNNDFNVGTGRSLTLNPGATLNCGIHFVTGTGTAAFIMTAGASSTLEISDAGGITATGGGAVGNIQVAGTRTYSITGNYIYDGSVAAMVTGNGLKTCNNLTINNTNGITMSGNIIVTNLLTLSSGDFIVGSNTLTLNGPAIAGTATNLSTNTTSNLIMGGASAGVSIPSSVTQLNALTINNTNAAGVAMNSSITLNQGTAGVLTLAGRLVLGSNDLIILSPLNTATISGTFSTTVMIIADGTGQLKKNFGTSGFSAFTFPVGDAAGSYDYSPFAITFVSNSLSRIIGVRVTDAVPPSNGGITDYASRYWTVTDNQFGNGTYSYSALSLTYSTVPPSDVNGNTANYRINRWDGTYWIQLNSTVTASTVTTTGTYDQISGTLGGNDFALRANSQATYHWVGTGTTPWTTPANWSPQRFSPQANDILYLDNGVTLTATNVPTETEYQIFVANKTNISLQAATNNAISINGPAAGNNLNVANGSTLQISTAASGTLTLNYGATTGQTGSISGTVIVNTNGTFTTANSTTAFHAGSLYNHNRDGGSLPLIASTVWDTASTCYISGIINTNPAGLSGTFGNLTWNCTGQATATGAISGAIKINGNLLVQAGKLTDGGFQITGNSSGTLKVSSGATFQIGVGTNTTEGFPALFTTGNITLDSNSTVYYNTITGITQLVSNAPSSYGNLNIGTSGTKTAKGALTVNRVLTISGGTFADGGNVITVKGNIINNGTHSGAGKILLSGGSSIHTLTGTPAAYGNLDLDDTQGANLSSTGTTAITGNLTLTNGKLTLGAFSTSLTVSGSTSINANGILTFNSITGTKTFTGDVTNNGIWDNSSVNSPITLGGNLVNNNIFNTGTGIFTTSGAGKTFSGTATTLNIQQLKVTGTYTNNIATLTVGTALSGAGTLTMGANTTLNIGGTSGITGLICTTNTPNTVVYNGAATQTTKNSATTFYNLTINPSAGITVTMGANTIVNNTLLVSTGTFANTGILTLTVSGLTTTISNGATFNYGSTGGATFVNFSNNGTWNHTTAAPIIINGTLNNSGTSWTTGTGLYTLSGGSGSSITGSSALKITNLAISATGNYNYDNSGGLTVGTLTVAASSGVLTLGNDLTINTSFLENGTLNCGTHFVKGTGSFALANAVTAFITICDPAGITTTGATGNIQVGGTRTYGAAANYTYNGSATIQATGNGLVTCNNLTINNTATNAIVNQTNTSITVNGTLTLLSGQYAVGGISATPNTLALNGPAIAGIATNLSTTTFSNLSFGTPTNSNAGLFIPSSVTNLNSLTINIAVAPVVNAVTLNSNISLGQATAGVLALTQGRLVLVNYNLIITSPSYSATISSPSFTTNAMIVADGAGQLMKKFGAGGGSVFTFPIGDNSGGSEVPNNPGADYSPVSITFSANSQERIIGVNVTDDQNKNDTSSTSFISRYWTFTDNLKGSGTYNYSATFTSSTNPPSDLTGTQSFVYFSWWNGSAWKELTTTYPSNSSFGIANLTQATAPIGTTIPIVFTGKRHVPPCNTMAPAMTAKANNTAVSASICLGANVNLSVTYTAGSACTAKTVFAWSDGSKYWNGSAFVSDSVVFNSAYNNIVISPAVNTTYTITGMCSNYKPCKTTSSVSVKVNPIPLISITTNPDPPVICPGSSVSLSASGASTYSWTPSTGLNSSNIPNPTASPSATTTYTVTGTNSSGCSSIAHITVIVKVHPTSVISSNPDSPVFCNKGNASFTSKTSGDKPISYQWQVNNGSWSAIHNGSIYSGATDSILKVTGDSVTAQYRCIASNCAGISTSNALTLTIVPPVNISYVTLNKQKCQGDSAVFIVVATGYTISYQWSKNGTPLQDATNSVFSIQSLVVSDTGSYSCKVSNMCYSRTVSTSLTVNLLPVINFQQSTNSDHDTCQGNPEIFNVIATGANLIYQWTKNGLPITGKTFTSYFIPFTSSSDAGIYSCKVTNSCGTVLLPQFKLTVYSPPVYQLPTSNYQLSVGDSAYLSVSLTGFLPFTYQWLHDSNIINGATNSVFSIPNIALSDSGLYSCKVTNTCGNTTAKIATLEVFKSGHYTVSGNVIYDNNGQTPMSNTIVYLYKRTTTNDELIDSTKTDNSGGYMFSSVNNGSYNLILKTSKAWGGSNPTDALLINRSFIGSYTITSLLRKQAADVNNDTKINPIDALIINKRYIGSIKHFSIPDWLFEKITITVNGAVVYRNIKAICAGDVNGSYPTKYYYELLDVR